MKRGSLFSLYALSIFLFLCAQDGAVADTGSGLPDHIKTPGAINAAVTAANIASTICVSGYTKTIRPPSSYTHNLKLEQLASGYTDAGDTRLSSYEEDHLIPLEIGGNPTSVKNLWPEPYSINFGAHEKDKLENFVHHLVCSGQMSLAFAQKLFSTNWILAYKKYL
jgi:hypothetical protein